MICTKCGGELAGTFPKKYCQRCLAIHRCQVGPDGESKIWVATGETYTPPQSRSMLRLQQGEAVNECFVLEIEEPPPPLHSPQRVEPPSLARPSERTFRRKPLLHFIWFGPVESIEKFAPAFLWGQCLPASWEGVCIWLDEKTFEALPGLSRFGCLQKVKGYVTTQRDSWLRSLGRIDSLERRTVHFISIDAYLETFNTDEAANRLVQAIQFERQHEPPWSLAQVASDIMRILVLCCAGGAYFDFDISPSMMTVNKGFVGGSMMELGSGGLFGHTKDPIVENDIIFADPTCASADKALKEILVEMAAYFKTADARAVKLHAMLEKCLGNGVKNMAQAYCAAQHPEQDLLVGLAKLVAYGLSRGSKDLYLRALTEEIKIFVKCVSDGIESATFQPFRGHVGGLTSEEWTKFSVFFSDETNSKLFYSWKDPGVASCIEYLKQQEKLDRPESMIVTHVAARYAIHQTVPMYQSFACGSMQVYYEVLSGHAKTTSIVVDRDYVQMNLEQCKVRSIATGHPTKTATFDIFSAFVHKDLLGSTVMPRID